MTPVTKRALHWVGSALAVVGVGYVALRLHDYYAQIDVGRFDALEWLTVFGFALLYGCANCFLAFAWWNLLEKFKARTSWLWALKVYGVSQLAKYLPGNIFHLAGRQAMGMAAGVPGWSLAKSAVWELGLISFTGGMFGLLALPLLFPIVAVPAAVGVFAVGAGLIAVALSRFSGAPSAWALCSYLAFLSVSGGLFAGLLDLVSDTSVSGNLSWLPLIGAFVIAWLVGLVTPGAPAGVGVRELVLLFLLKGVVVEADLVFAVILGRLVTVLGDVMFFIVALVIDDKGIRV